MSEDERDNSVRVTSAGEKARKEGENTGVG